MSTKLNTNGQAARKSLAEQIDRLDGMLDGLSDGLSEAVAAAVKDAVGAAVQQAVQAVLREMLTSPELLARLHAASPTAAPAPAAAPTAAPAQAAAPKTPKVSWKQRWASVRQALAASMAMVRLECGRRLEQARRWTVGAWHRVCILGRLSYPLVTAVVVGVTAGVAACYARPWLAAAVSVGGSLAATTAALGRAVWKR